MIRNTTPGPVSIAWNTLFMQRTVENNVYTVSQLQLNLHPVAYLIQLCVLDYGPVIGMWNHVYNGS